jgi:uncharacterized membrane protein YhaH (DUF805 family)
MLNFFFGFAGRIRRRAYVFGLLGGQLGLAVAALIIIEASGAAVFVIDPRQPGQDVLSPFARMVFTATLLVIGWMTTALFFKRFHDFSEASQHKLRYLKLAYLVSVAPHLLLNTVSVAALGHALQSSDGILTMLAGGLLLMTALIGPERGPNRFGEDPRGPTLSPAPATDDSVAPVPALATPPNALRMREMARTGASAAIGQRPLPGKAVFGRR